MAVISGPSGSGKGTIISLLPDYYRKSVSATTRKMRDGEIEGFDYFFVSRQKFTSMRMRDELIEYNYYNGNYYGTPKAQIEQGKAKGLTTLFDIDIHGAENIKRLYPDAPMIYLLVPSAKEQIERIKTRGQNTPEQIAERLEITKAELDKIDMFDLVLINEKGEMERCAAALDDFLCGRKTADEITDYSRVREIVEHYFD